MYWAWVKADGETFTTFGFTKQEARQQLCDALAKHAPGARWSSLTVHVAPIEAGGVYCEQAPLVPLVR